MTQLTQNLSGNTSPNGEQRWQWKTAGDRAAALRFRPVGAFGSVCRRSRRLGELASGRKPGATAVMPREKVR